MSDKDQERIKALEKALHNLYHDVKAVVGVFEKEMDKAVGYTNVACMKSRLEQAAAALQKPRTRFLVMKVDESKAPPLSTDGSTPCPWLVVDTSSTPAFQFSPDAFDHAAMLNERAAKGEPI